MKINRPPGEISLVTAASRERTSVGESSTESRILIFKWAVCVDLRVKKLAAAKWANNLRIELVGGQQWVNCSTAWHTKITRQANELFIDQAARPTIRSASDSGESRPVGKQVQADRTHMRHQQALSSQPYANHFGNRSQQLEGSSLERSSVFVLLRCGLLWFTFFRPPEGLILFQLGCVHAFSPLFPSTLFDMRLN